MTWQSRLGLATAGEATLLTESECGNLTLVTQQIWHLGYLPCNPWKEIGEERQTLRNKWQKKTTEESAIVESRQHNVSELPVCNAWVTM